MTATLAGPPEAEPATQLARLMKKLEMPVRSRLPDGPGGPQAFAEPIVIDGIEHEDGGHAEDGDAGAAAAELHGGQDADDADDDLIAADIQEAQADGEVLGAEADIKEGSGTQDHQYPVIPGDVVGLLHALFGRIDQVAAEEDTAQEAGITDQVQPGGKQGHIDHEDREGRQNAVDGPLLPAGPDAHIGIPVILAHDLVHSRRVEFLFCGLGLRLCRSRGGLIYFVAFRHFGTSIQRKMPECRF